MGGLFHAIGSLFGAPGFEAGAAQLQEPTTAGQANQLYNQSQVGLGAQAQLAQALGAGGAQGIGNQSQLAQALSQQAQGLGPNPAQAALAQATGANVANQAALMAGQRGASSNAGLIARQAAQQGAGIQQQAVGQGALMQAQQQLAAQQNLANLSGQQIGQQVGAIGGLNAATQQEQNQILNAINQQNANNVAMQSNINTSNAGVAQAGVPYAAKTYGGVGNAIGGALGVGALFAKGGMVMPPHLHKIASLHYPQMKWEGGYAEGHRIPGKAKVKGDSPKNDVVPILASPGEVVLPRSVMNSSDPVAESAKFVEALLHKQGSSGKKEKGEFKEALKSAISSRRKKR